MMCDFGLQAPLIFSGSLEELYEKWAQQVLLDPETVKTFHRHLITYYQESIDPIYLVRKTGSLIRRETIRNQHGLRIRATDNAPSWWIHHLLFTEDYKKFDSFKEIINAIPCHMFNIQLPVHINKIGWHIAHIFNVNDGNSDYQIWDTKELLRRTMRNIHPCNYFYIPKTDWQIYGENPDVIAFFYEKFKQRYHSIWNEFLQIISAEKIKVEPSSLGFIYTINGNNQKEMETIRKPKQQSISKKNIDRVASTEDLSAWYEYSRLSFKANYIEPLSMTEKFGVFTPVATFVMTKQDFYDVFNNVVKSRSYRENGFYHYPRIPKKAKQFIYSITGEEK